MPNYKIVLEFKDRHLTRPILDQIVGAALRTNPDAKEIIVRCRTSAKTVYDALTSYGIRIEIIESGG